MDRAGQMLKSDSLLRTCLATMTVRANANQYRVPQGVKMLREHCVNGRPAKDDRGKGTVCPCECDITHVVLELSLSHCLFCLGGCQDCSLFETLALTEETKGDRQTHETRKQLKNQGDIREILKGKREKGGTKTMGKCNEGPVAQV